MQNEYNNLGAGAHPEFLSGGEGE